MATTAAAENLVILNPAAGKRLARILLEPIVEDASREHMPAAVITTQKRGDATEIAARHGGKFRRIICCGGDGTLNETLNGLARAGLRVPVGYVPAGSTNDMAVNLGLPKRKQKAIDFAVSGEPLPWDAGLFQQDAYFDYVAAFGAFTDVSYSTPQSLKNVLGHMAYILWGIKRVVSLSEPVTTQVTADGETAEGDFIYGSVSNSGRVAGFLKLPFVPDDGLFELLLIRQPTNQLELAATLDGLRRQDFTSDRFVFRKASKITFRFGQETAWTVDGEYAGSHREVTIENRRKQFLLVANRGRETNSASESQPQNQP